MAEIDRKMEEARRNNEYLGSDDGTSTGNCERNGLVAAGCERNFVEEKVALRRMNG